MMPRNVAFLVAIAVFAAGTLFAQHHVRNTVQIVFHPRYENAPLGFDTSRYGTAAGPTVTVSMLKFYVTDIVLNTLDGDNLRIPGHYLVDCTDDERMSIAASVPEEAFGLYSGLSFRIGVDSVVNELGPSEGDLDPINGMYWTWSTGYIFCKLEGTVEHGDAPKRVYEIHIGGYKAPFNNVMQLKGTMSKPVDAALPSARIDIDVNVDTFFNSEAPFNIMARPSVTDARQAVDVAPRILEMFRVR